MKNEDKIICYEQETYFKSREPDRLKVKGQRKVYHANINEKKSGLAIFISDTAVFRTQKIIRNEDRTCMIKG